MHWALTRKVAAIATIYLVLIVVLATIIGLNTLETRKAVTYLENSLIEEVRLTGAYHTSLQRLMTEIVMYVYTDEEEEYEEAVTSLEQLEGFVAALEILEDSKMNQNLHIDTYQETHEALRTQQHTLIASGSEILDSAAAIRINSTSSPVNLSTIFEEIEELEEQRETLDDQSTEHIKRIRTATVAQVAAHTTTTVASIGGAIASLILLTALIVWLVAAYVVRPVKLLAQAAQAVSGGNLNQAVSVTSRDEIGTLQESFNTMVATLQERTSQLEVQYTQAAAAKDEAEAACNEAEVARDEAEAAHRSVAAQLEVIEHQQQTIREMSVPILPLTATALVVPLVGAIDTERAQQIMERLLEQVAAHCASVIIIDITGVSLIDTQVAQALIQTTQSVKLLGARVILTGICPQIAQTLVELGIDLSGIVTHSTLQVGIEYALRSKPIGENGR